MPPSTAASLQTLSAAHRLARAASLWLRREQGITGQAVAQGPEHRDLLAGVVAGLGQWLCQERQVLELAAYALALLEQERDDPLDTSRRLEPAEPISAGYAAGLRAADRLVASLDGEGEPANGARGYPHLLS